jgi:hypothetical protein
MKLNQHEIECLREIFENPYECSASGTDAQTLENLVRMNLVRGERSDFNTGFEYCSLVITDWQNSSKSQRLTVIGLIDLANQKCKRTIERVTAEQR